MCNLSSVNLRDKAVAVKLTRRMFNDQKVDVAITDGIDAANGTTKAGKYKKRLLKDCSELAQVQRAFGDVYQYVRANSLPWMDEGMRVVPNTYYMEFLDRYRDLRDHAMDCVDKLATVWDQRVVEDQRSLKQMWDPNDYPSAEEMKEMWSIRLMPMPIPSSEDFRIDLDEADKALLDERVAEVQSDATVYVMRELFEPVKAMAEKLSVEKGEKGSVFRDTLVSNVTDACRRAKALNVNADERITETVAEVEKIVEGLSAKDLRESDAIRSHTGKRMSELENKMSSWFN